MTNKIIQKYDYIINLLLNDLFNNFFMNLIKKDSEFPTEDGFNPYLNRLKEDGHNITNLRLSQSVQAHNMPISW
jgi:hypothetical protein